MTPSGESRKTARWQPRGRRAAGALVLVLLTTPATGQGPPTFERGPRTARDPYQPVPLLRYITEPKRRSEEQIEADAFSRDEVGLYAVDELMPDRARRVAAAVEALEARDLRLRELEVAVQEARRDLVGTEALARGGGVAAEDVDEAREELRFVETRLQVYKQETKEADWLRAESARRSQERLTSLELERDARVARLRAAEALRDRAEHTLARAAAASRKEEPESPEVIEARDELAFRRAQVDLRRVELREIELPIDQARRLAAQPVGPVGEPAAGREITGLPRSAPRGRAEDVGPAETYQIRVVQAQPQTQPDSLTCQGQTAGDPDVTNTVRAPFDGTVVKVFAPAGLRVKRGDPLIEIFSSDLFEAKVNHASRKAAWVRSTEALTVLKDAARRGRGDTPRLVDAENEVERTRLEYQAAEDKLRIIFSLSDEDIQTGGREAYNMGRLMILSPAGGVVTTRDAVPGNRYDKTAVLMTVAQLDHLWVVAEVPEAEQPRVRIGMTANIEFPYQSQVIQARIVYLSNQVDLQTHTIQARFAIPNPDDRLRIGERARVRVEIPPTEGQTVVPTSAVAVVRGWHYMFVRTPGETERYERRRIQIGSVQNDYVVVRNGLKAGEVVVSNPPTFSARDRRLQARREYLVGLIQELDDLHMRALRPAQEAPAQPRKD